jgi:hypothetical protein
MPETTLRNTVLENVHPDTVAGGKSPLFTEYEEVM